MKLVIKTVITALSMSFFLGCTIATPVVSSGKYEGMANDDPAMSKIYVYRDQAFAGGTNQYDVMVNGVLSGSLPNGSFFETEVEPGDTKVEPRTLTSFGFGKGVSSMTDPGGIYCFKLTLNFCLQCKSADIDKIDTEQCESEIQNLKKVELK
ncbi:DUF2846 domain-containing protein [Alcanivorax sp.]|uniref:DUF2846 domain-containing protein n=1 Tax=Alcanivorax sp. TaxID=1872427 RepID=UPI000C5003E5|nr:DUF2846 domain-containing protein [Alcanivorax sp.]MBQ25271.1 hypothetical protein [Alcanivorax sp.]|tara:strand:- start:1938 stop:2393 length:456 start_codon:yes stop_codon:yes gene_type:complete